MSEWRSSIYVPPGWPAAGATAGSAGLGGDGDGVSVRLLPGRLPGVRRAASPPRRAGTVRRSVRRRSVPRGPGGPGRGADKPGGVRARPRCSRPPWRHGWSRRRCWSGRAGRSCWSRRRSADGYSSRSCEAAALVLLLLRAPPGGPAADGGPSHLRPAAGAVPARLAVFDDRAGVHAALLDRRLGRLAEGSAKGRQLVDGKRLRGSARRDPRLPERLVRQQVADAGDDALVEQPRLDRCRAAADPAPRTPWR